MANRFRNEREGGVLRRACFSVKRPCFLLLVRPGAPSSFLLLLVRHLFLVARHLLLLAYCFYLLLVTSSKALVTRSDAPVPSSKHCFSVEKNVWDPNLPH